MLFIALLRGHLCHGLVGTLNIAIETLQNSTVKIESGIICGLSVALYGEISITNGAVIQSNHDY
jgi:hypothetical protein